MRLSEYTDYSLRVLMYCAVHRQSLVTVGELAERHGVSKNHLMKVVNDLARQGLLETTRGRGGGLRLPKPPAEIRVGDVVRASETDFRLVECFDPQTNACSLSPSCRLRLLFQDGLQAFFAQLDGATLADIVGPLPPPREGASAHRPVIPLVSAPQEP
jgi:Rrf2 family nitric oxide-sensitive transcriptional repressor